MSGLIGRLHFDTGTPVPFAPAASAGHLHTALDGELLNARALRLELRRLGHRFDADSDGEVVLRAYEEWGPRAFARLRGPFACAVWDSIERRLVIARDHVGVRPLYYAVVPDGVLFATSLRALVDDPAIGREWCPSGIDAFLAIGYIPAPLTPFRRVSKLPAAHLLIVEGRRARVEQYWDLPAAERIDDRRMKEVPQEIVAALGSELRDAVTRQNHDAAIKGVLYGGALASTTLLAAAGCTGGPAITVPLLDDPNELTRSARAANMLGRAQAVTELNAEVPVLAREVAAQCDEPIGDPWALSQFAIAQGAHRYASAVIGAHGAPTLWAGDARHRIERLESMVRASLAAPLASLSAELARPLQDLVRGARAVSHLGLPPADAYAVKHAYGYWDDGYRRALYTRTFAWDVRNSNPYARHLDLYASRDAADPLDRALYVDAHTVLADSVLPIAAGAARAAGLRLRLPMLDVDFAAFAARVPAAIKQHGGTAMYPLHALIARELPPSLMPTPRLKVLRHPWLLNAVRELVPTMLLTTRFDARGLASRPALRELWNEHASGRRNHAHRLWSLLMLEFWCRHAIDGNAADIPLEYAVRSAA